MKRVKMLVNMDWSEEEIETKRKEIEQREQQQLKNERG